MKGVSDQALVIAGYCQAKADWSAHKLPPVIEISNQDTAIFQQLHLPLWATLYAKAPQQTLVL